MNYADLKLKYAQAMVEEETLYYGRLHHKVITESEHKDQYAYVEDLRAALAKHPDSDVLRVYVSGTAYGYGTDGQYDVQRLVEAEFGDRIVCDAEFSCFYAYLTEAVVPELEQFLNKTFPENASFTFVFHEDEGMVPEVGNWCTAKQYVQQHGG